MHDVGPESWDDADRVRAGGGDLHGVAPRREHVVQHRRNRRFVIDDQDATSGLRLHDPRIILRFDGYRSPGNFDRHRPYCVRWKRPPLREYGHSDRPGVVLAVLGQHVAERLRISSARRSIGRTSCPVVSSSRST
jgi:hypothetical protein